MWICHLYEDMSITFSLLCCLNPSVHLCVVTKLFCCVQKAEFRCLLPRTLLKNGFFPLCTPQIENNDKCFSSSISAYSWSGQRKMPSYLNRLVFPDDFLTALRTIAMKEDELYKVTSLLREVCFLSVLLLIQFLIEKERVHKENSSYKEMREFLHICLVLMPYSYDIFTMIGKDSSISGGVGGGGVGLLCYLI